MQARECWRNFNKYACNSSSKFIVFDISQAWMLECETFQTINFCLFFLCVVVSKHEGVCPRLGGICVVYR